MHSRRRPVRDTSRTPDCKKRKNIWVNLDLLLLRSWHVGQLGTQSSRHCASPTARGNGTTGWLRTSMRWRLQLCTCSSRLFLLWLVRSHIIGTCIQVRGRCPLRLLPGLQYLIQILFSLLLVAILIVRFFFSSDSFPFSFAFFLLVEGVPFSAAAPPSWYEFGSLLHLWRGRCRLSSSRLTVVNGGLRHNLFLGASTTCTFWYPS